MTFKVKDGVQVGSILALDANAKLTTGLSTARTIALSGDVAGSTTFDGTGNVTIATTIQANSVALGTDTTGNYMVNVAAGTGVSVSHTQGEGSTATVSIGQPVATTDNVTFANINATGNVVVDGDLTVSGTTVTISATNLAVEDNMIYLNNGSTVSNPDLGFAGNYNDGSYKHAGFFRDATDGRWKVFQGYTLEPDASAFIDTAHASFALADIQASTFHGALSGNASTASKWATARTLSYTGDATGSMSVDGSANASAALTLANSGVTAGTYGSGTAIPVLTVDAKGRVTSATTSAVTIGTGTLALSIGTAGATNTTVTIGTGSGFNANSTSNYTYDIKVGPALTALATLMTSGSTGFIKRTGVDTYSIDTNTYLTSYSETDTLATVTARGSSTTGTITVNGYVLSQGTAGNRGGIFGNLQVGYAGTYNTIQTPTNADTVWLQYSHSGNVGLAYGGGYTTAYQSIRSPIFYDSDNTGYYADPASTSQFNTILANGLYQAGYTSGSLSSGTWYTIAANAGDRASAEFIIIDMTSGLHQSIHFNAAAHFGTTGTIAVLSNSYYSGPPIAYIRIKQGSTYEGAALQVYVNSACSGVAVYMMNNYQSNGWVLKNWINDNTNPGTIATWANLTERTRVYTAHNGYSSNSIGYGIGFDSKARLTQGNGQSLRISNDYGYLDIGSQNTSWLHYYTDRSGNYWDKYGENVASWRAPIFYDSNDTSYYIDPNSTSYQRSLFLGAHDSGTSEFRFGEDSSSWYGERWYWDSAYTVYKYSRYAGTDSTICYHDTRYTDKIYYGRNILFDNYGIGIVGSYSASRYQGVFAMGDSYKLPADGTTTGTLYGLAWSHPNAGGVASNLNTHGLLAMENGTWLASLSGSVRARDDMRAPIFYDRNDTSYYCDPNSTSVFYAVNMWGRLATDNSLDYSSSAVTGLTSAPLAANAIYDPSVGTSNLFLPMTHQTSLHSGGYRTHLSTGLYKLASGWGENSTGWYAALGGSDSYPTMHWRLTYGTHIYNSNGYVSTDGSFRAPIFYDFNDTGYYVDPRSTSILSGLRLNGVDNNASGSDYILWINKPNNNDWAIGISGQYDYNITYDGAASHSYGVRGLKGGSEYWRVGTDLLYHNASVRAPIFYDTDNTGYYVDPSSTTYINTLTAAGNITANSDVRLKRDIVKIDNAIEKVKKLNGVTFTRIDVEDTTKRYAGLIAQEVLEVLPEAVEGTATYSVAYGNMVGLLVEAIKEQQSEIDELKALVKQLLAK